MRHALLSVCLCALLFLTASPASAARRFLIDGIHGQQSPITWYIDFDLAALYPETEFELFGVERLPLYDVLAAGMLDGSWDDSVVVDVPAGTHALYVIVTDQTIPPEPGGPPYYPFVIIAGPDQSVTSGGYGFGHIDDPAPGRYAIHAGRGENPVPYLIGTGPYLWEVQAPGDYDGVIDFHTMMWSFWTGDPPARSPADYQHLQNALNAGVSVGLFYDGADPIADKPIVRMRGFLDEGATIRIAPPALPVYTLPKPQRLSPLEWEIAPTSGEVELDYEVQFRSSMNFVWSAPASGAAVNLSWATVRDLKLIEFVRGEGYRISEIGTLPPGAKADRRAGAAESFGSALRTLDRMLRAEALRAGLTTEETESFFRRCDWPLRILARCSAEPGAMALFYIDGADYDALFPLTCDPVPAEIRRVLWVQSWLPERVNRPARVHAPCALPAPAAPGPVGEYHEYGVLHETYGGDALDEMDAWDWHFFDGMLADSTDPGAPWGEFGNWGAYYFDTWGASPLAAQLAQNVTRVEGLFTSAIGNAQPNEVVLSGDEDTRCEWVGEECPFGPGSYPPLVVARQMTAGNWLLALADNALLADQADNVQFGRNIWAALDRPHTDDVPELDLPDAAIDFQLPAGGVGQSSVWIHNRGDAQLQTQIIPPTVDWLTANGSNPRSISPHDSTEYTLYWNAAALEEGFYTATWLITTNDANEDTVYWLTRLQVGTTFAADPEHPALPAEFTLHAPYPNPFNPATTVSFELARAGRVRLELYNTLGQRVAQLTDQVWAAGTHSLRVDLGDRAAGLYFLRAEHGGSVAVRKLMLVK